MSTRPSRECAWRRSSVRAPPIPRHDYDDLLRDDVTSVSLTGSLEKFSISIRPVSSSVKIFPATASLPTPLPSPSKRMSASVNS